HRANPDEADLTEACLINGAGAEINRDRCRAVAREIERVIPGSALYEAKRKGLVARHVEDVVAAVADQAHRRGRGGNRQRYPDVIAHRLEDLYDAGGRDLESAGRRGAIKVDGFVRIGDREAAAAAEIAELQRREGDAGAPCAVECQAARVISRAG